MWVYIYGYSVVKLGKSAIWEDNPQMFLCQITDIKGFFALMDIDKLTLVAIIFINITINHRDKYRQKPILTSLIILLPSSFK